MRRDAYQVRPDMVDVTYKYLPQSRASAQAHVRAAAYHDERGDADTILLKCIN